MWIPANLNECNEQRLGHNAELEKINNKQTKKNTLISTSNLKLKSEIESYMVCTFHYLHYMININRKASNQPVVVL